MRDDVKMSRETLEGAGYHLREFSQVVREDVKMSTGTLAGADDLSLSRVPKSCEVI